LTSQRSIGSCVIIISVYFVGFGGCMKKIFLGIIIFSLFFTLVSCSDETEPENMVDSFEIYLATNDSVREFGYYDTENLILKDEPLLTDKDIRHYYWDQHIIELNGSFLEDVFTTSTVVYDEFNTNLYGMRQYITGGSKFLSTSQNMGFVIVINGEKIYSGTFPVGPELATLDEKLIIGDIADDKLAILYTGDEFDIRNNDSIYNFFQKSGKLAQMSGEDSTELVKELQERLDASENNYIELQKKFDELVEVPVNTREDYKEATISWLQNRLNLYILETQEGEDFKNFSDSLLELDLSKVKSVSEAADIFRQAAIASTEKNDRMFNVFEEMYYVIIDGISKYNSIDEIDDNFINLAAENWITVNTAGGKITAYPSVGKLRENFGVFLSPQLNEYLLIKDLERGVMDTAESADVISGDELKVELKFIADFIYLWKEFTIDYPYAYPFNFKAQIRSEKLLDVYIGKTILMESPIYDEETLAIKDTARENYELFIEDYTESPYSMLISDLYGVMKDNAFIFSMEVREFIANVDYDDYR